MNREKLLTLINENLLSTEDTAKQLNITKTRLNKIKELNAVIRGYYLKIDIDDYMNSKEVQERREKYKRNV